MLAVPRGRAHHGILLEHLVASLLGGSVGEVEHFRAVPPFALDVREARSADGGEGAERLWDLGDGFCAPQAFGERGAVFNGRRRSLEGN